MLVLVLLLLVFEFKLFDVTLSLFNSPLDELLFKLLAESLFKELPSPFELLPLLSPLFSPALLSGLTGGVIGSSIGGSTGVSSSS